MAFPSITAQTSGAQTVVTSTSVVVTLPTHSTGDLVLIALRNTGGGLFTVSGVIPWTTLANEALDGSGDRTGIFARIMDGTEPATLTLTYANAGRCAWMTWNVIGFDTTDPTPFTTVTALTGNSLSIDPPSISPDAAPFDFLYIALATQQGENVITAFPTNYTLAQAASSTGTTGAAANNCNLWTAARQLAAGTENPGAFTVTNLANFWTAYTIAIHPQAPPTSSEFTGRGLVASFGYGNQGRTRRYSARWDWLWRQMTFCLPFNDPVVNNGGLVGVFPNMQFQCYDVGRARMGDGGRLGGANPFTVPTRYQGDVAVAVGTPPSQLPGNAGLLLNNGALTTSGTNSWLAYYPTSGGLPLNLWNDASRGITFAMVYTPHRTGSGFGGSFRQTIASTSDAFGTELGFETISFSSTSISWLSFLSPFVAIHRGAHRSVWVFTGAFDARGRQVYQNGELVGSNAVGVAGLGNLGLHLGRASTLIEADGGAGLFELFLVTDDHWTQDQVRQFSAQPFEFLVPRRRPRPLAIVLPEDPCDWFADQPAPDWATAGGAPWLQAQAGGAWLVGQSPDWATLVSGADWFAPKEC